MNFFSFLTTASKYLSRFIQMQLFLTLVSWPILLYWGLPLSLASPVGNLIFTPFIMLFLLLSSLIFFCEILYIPNSIFIYFLEQLTALWLGIVSWARSSWLLHCAQPPMLFAFLIPLAACVLLQHKKLSNNTKNICALAALFCCSFLYLRYIPAADSISSIACHDKEITLITTAQSSVLIDTGTLGRRVSADSWVQYSLIPLLTKKGLTELTYVIVLKAGAQVFKALATLSKNYRVKNIYLLSWEGSLNNKGWAYWQELLETSKHYGTSLTLIENKSITVQLSAKLNLIIIPETKLIKKQRIRYPRTTVTVTGGPQELYYSNS